jgi:hypothetical protein
LLTPVKLFVVIFFGFISMMMFSPGIFYAALGWVGWDTYKQM